MSNVGSELKGLLGVAKKTPVLVHVRRHSSDPTLYMGARGAEQCGATISSDGCFFRPRRTVQNVGSLHSHDQIAHNPQTDRPAAKQTD